MAHEIIDLDNPEDHELTFEMEQEAKLNAENPSPPPMGTAVEDSPDKIQEFEDFMEDAPLKSG